MKIDSNKFNCFFAIELKNMNQLQKVDFISNIIAVIKDNWNFYNWNIDTLNLDEEVLIISSEAWDKDNEYAQLKGLQKTAKIINY